MQLLMQRVKIFDNFNTCIREQKLITLCRVMGLSYSVIHLTEHLEHYVLTLDNCLKMMAIYLKFMSNIPVLIMGETGCGKTSLIEFFSFMHLS